MWLFLKVKWFLFIEALEVRRRFPAFARYEKAFRRAYRFQNPFRICKQFLRRRGEKLIDAYGETPLPVFAQIARYLSSSDTVIELGCGRGKGVFFLSQLLGCSVIGIDWIPHFIQTAESIHRSLSPSLPVGFRCEEMQRVDLSKATAVYLYGTCLTDDEIHSLIPRFERLQPGARIITVSFPLSDYSSKFLTISQLTASFPWGEAEVYVCTPKVDS
jgi:hypothetical protein